MLCLITCHGRMMPLLAELLFLLDTTTVIHFQICHAMGKRVFGHMSKGKAQTSLRIQSNQSLYFLITKTCLYNADPHKPHFYIVKTGVYMGIQYFTYFCSKT